MRAYAQNIKKKCIFAYAQFKNNGGIMPNRDGTGSLGLGLQMKKALGSCNNKQLFPSNQSFGGAMSRANRKGKGNGGRGCGAKGIGNRLNNSNFGRGQS